MRPAIGALQSACSEAFDAYANRAELNEKKALMLDYLMRRGYVNDRHINEAREFARMEENHD